MIRINLQSAGQRKAKKRAAAPVDSGGTGGPGHALSLMLLVLPIAGALGGSFVVHRSLVAEIDDVTARTRAAEAEIARLKPILDELNRYKREREQLERKLAAIRQLEAARTGPVKTFAELSAIIPPQVWVTSIRERGGQAQIDGVGLDDQSVAVFVNAMLRSPQFEAVELNLVEQTPYLGLNVKRFTVTSAFRSGARPPAAQAAGGPGGPAGPAAPAGPAGRPAAAPKAGR
jgi:type IV pilus assembly protein PilN